MLMGLGLQVVNNASALAIMVGVITFGIRPSDYCQNQLLLVPVRPWLPWLQTNLISMVEHAYFQRAGPASFWTCRKERSWHTNLQALLDGMQMELQGCYLGHDVGISKD